MPPPRDALVPVVVGLRLALHLLVLSVTTLVVVSAEPGRRTPVIVLAVALLAVYAAGALRGGPSRRRARRAPHRSGPGAGVLWARGWLALLTALWLALLSTSPQASYLVFPLYFLHLHLLPRWWGPAAVVVAALAAVVATAADGGLTTGGVVGPVLAAGVALAIGLVHRALAREAAEREALLAELVAARSELAASERQAGALAERARIARDLHDTVAQGLSSIQLLLHVAERADPGSPAVPHVRLARETAAGDLAEARALIAELAPPPLAEDGLLAALRRLAATGWSRPGLVVEVSGSGRGGLPGDAPTEPTEPTGRTEPTEPPVQVATALLRIAQGAVANALQHAQASRVEVELSRSPGTTRLVVRDDGRGFDPRAVAERTAGGAGHFGLRAVRERTDQLGGVLGLRSAPGRGTTLSVELPDVPGSPVAAVPAAAVPAAVPVPRPAGAGA